MSPNERPLHEPLVAYKQPYRHRPHAEKIKKGEKDEKVDRKAEAFLRDSGAYHGCFRSIHVKDY